MILQRQQAPASTDQAAPAPVQSVSQVSCCVKWGLGRCIGEQHRSSNAISHDMCLTSSRLLVWIAMSHFLKAVEE